MNLNNPTNQPCVSVVIPAHNEETLLQETLKGLLAQRALPYEVIVVDNASTDKTHQIAYSYKKLFQNKQIRFSVLKEQRLGSAFARNTGFLKATSPIIASLDADAIPRPDWTRNIIRHFTRFDSVAVTGIPVMRDAPYLIRLITEYNWYKYLTLLLKYIFGFQTITTATSAIRKNAYLKTKGFDGNITVTHGLDDTALSKELSRIGPVRVDTSIKVDASFRRYETPKKALLSTLDRMRGWIAISKNNTPNGCKKT